MLSNEILVIDGREWSVDIIEVNELDKTIFIYKELNIEGLNIDTTFMCGVGDKIEAISYITNILK